MEKQLLGQKVSYVRLNEKNEEIRSEGVVHAVFLAADKRIQARVIDGDKQLNVDFSSIGLTDEGAKRYFEGAREIRARADEINKGIVMMTTRGNAEIEKLYTKYLGAPVEL